MSVKFDAALLLRLIRDQGTLEQASSILRARGLEHSGSNWDDMIDRRLLASLNDGKLSEQDMIAIFAEVEEHGRQHVFLYELGRGKTIDHLFDKATLRRLLKSSQRFPNLGEPSFVESPETPVIVEVRYETHGEAAFLVIKVVEPREQHYNKQETESGGRRTITFDVRRYRAVNVVRIWKSGLVELRIFSHRDPISYQGLATALWGQIDAVVQQDMFRICDLAPFRGAFWDKDRREDVQKLFALRSSDHKNAAGNRVRAAATASDTTMFDDPDLIASMDSFHSERSAAECERATVALRHEASGGKLNRNVNLLLHGETNEFTITSKVTRSEYEFVLDSILKNNK
ncbi:MAG: hypothetical protein NT113_17100 [Hyphomicrobiales bacterium]|nr:hypothetical protein [Hyphomicrobiales bacterium]